jgi:hypothetical protein
MAWVYRNASVTQSAVIDKYGVTQAEWVFGFLPIGGNDRLYAWVFDLSANAHLGRYVGTVDSFAPGGIWNHVAWTYNGGGLTTSTKIYINGIRRDDNDFTGGTYVAMENTAITPSIGDDNGGTAGAMAGRISDVRIYRRVLTQEEIVKSIISHYEIFLQSDPRKMITQAPPAPGAPGTKPQSRPRWWGMLDKIFYTHK